MSEYKLTEELMKLSKAENWDKAKLEWGVKYTVEVNFFETCLCGHYPIANICVIENTTTGHSARIGRCCAKRFMGDKVASTIRSVVRIKGDYEKSLSAEAIQLAYSKGWINGWEEKFAIDTIRKRKLSEKQTQIRVRINKKILDNVL